MKFLNIWRPILQQMLVILSKKARDTVENTLKLFLSRKAYESDEDRLIILMDIYGMRNDENEGDLKLPLKADPI